MSNRFYFATEIPFPMASVWPLVDFPTPGWTIGEGGPREIGATRSLDIPGIGLVVDRLFAYSRSEHVCTFSYALVAKDNFLGAQGYEGTVTLLRNTQDPSRCFYTYVARWDRANASVHETLASVIASVVGQVVADLGAAAGR